ncbi:MAG: monovalent cation/H(+) antiporter subunit G [Ignisphaera sp.]
MSFYWVEKIIEILGLIFISAGAFFEFVAAIGFFRMPNFYTRVHALTIGAVGGTVLPLIGVALLAISKVGADPSRLYLATLCIISAIIILIVAPTGSHALVRSAYIHSKQRREEYRESVVGS